MHSLSYIHRDLSIDKILLEFNMKTKKWNAKLSDFGTALQLKKREAASRASKDHLNMNMRKHGHNTVRYKRLTEPIGAVSSSAPEMVLCFLHNGDPYECKGYLFPSDIYSYAILLWNIFRNPFLYFAIERLGNTTNHCKSENDLNNAGKSDFILEAINKTDTMDLFPKKRLLKKVNSIANITAVSEFYNSITPENIKSFNELFCNPFTGTDYSAILNQLKVKYIFLKLSYFLLFFASQHNKYYIIPSNIK
jgi:serine/threonine protein kinase